MAHVRMHLLPPQLPTRMRVEVAMIASPSGALRPAEFPTRARPSGFDPPFLGGPHVDVLLDGSAYPPAHGGSIAGVDATVGAWSWSASVIGRRTATRGSDGVVLSAAEVFDAPVRLDWESCFGGGAPSAPPGPRRFERDLDAAALCPRNPFGKGYRPSLDRGPWELPRIEDPDDPLTADRLERIAQEGWLAAPLPWCLAEVHRAAFPRSAFIAGMGPRVDEPSRLPEIRRGFLGEPLPVEARPQIDPRILQDAPPWGWLNELPVGVPIRVEGCLPRGEAFAASVPSAPGADVVLDGRRSQLTMRAARLVLRPLAGELLVVWFADVDLPRPFIPGVHRRIPIEVHVEGIDPVPYPTPPVGSPPDPGTV